MNKRNILTSLILITAVLTSTVKAHGYAKVGQQLRTEAQPAVAIEKVSSNDTGTINIKLDFKNHGSSQTNKYTVTVSEAPKITAKPTAAEQALIPHHLLDIVEPDASFSVADGDIYLLCTDGLTNMVSDKAIAEILSHSSSPIDELIDAALDNGGHDNISAIVVAV